MFFVRFNVNHGLTKGKQKTESLYFYPEKDYVGELIIFLSQKFYTRIENIIIGFYHEKRFEKFYFLSLFCNFFPIFSYFYKGISLKALTFSSLKYIPIIVGNFNIAFIGNINLLTVKEHSCA